MTFTRVILLDIYTITRTLSCPSLPNQKQPEGDFNMQNNFKKLAATLALAAAPALALAGKYTPPVTPEEPVTPTNPVTNNQTQNQNQNQSQIANGGAGGHGGQGGAGGQGGQGGTGYGGQGGNATGGNATGGTGVGVGIGQGGNATGGTSHATGGQSNANASTGPVNVTNAPVTNTTYRAAASTAVGAAPTIVNSGCQESLSLGLGVQTLGHGASGSIGIPMGQNKDCSYDNAANNMLNSQDETVRYIGVESHAQKHEGIRNSMDRIEQNLEALSPNGEDVVINKGDGHRVLGGAFARLRYKTPVATVVEPAQAAPVINVTVETAPCAAAPAARAAAPVARKAAAPKLDCK